MTEKKMNEFYAADSGAEDALWQIANDKLEDTFGDYTSPGGYDQYDYSSNWAYNLSEQLNSNSVNVTIGNVWIPRM